MTSSVVRVAIVGASSLLGRELANHLSMAAGTAWDLALFDSDDSAGQMTAAGEEALVIQPLAPDVFAGVHIAFFAGDVAATREYWREATKAGAAVVDLTGALAANPGVEVRMPLLVAAGLQDARLDLSVDTVIAAHPVTLMLGCIAARLRALGEAHGLISATVLLPASEQGKAGVDELHAQTMALLSFQDPPREVYGAQVAYSLSAGFGPDARADLAATECRIQAEFNAVFGIDAATQCVFQCIQAPVFHGCAGSIYLGLHSARSHTEITAALALPDLLGVSDSTEEPPSNATLGEQEVMRARVRSSGESGIWLWLVADDLALQARNAIACASELLAIRPVVSRVQ